MVDDFLEEEKQRSMSKSSNLTESSRHMTEQLKPQEQIEEMDLNSSQYSDDNVLLKSMRPEDDLMRQSIDSVAGKPDFFENEEQNQLKDALKEAHKLQLQNDLDARESKR